MVYLFGLVSIQLLLSCLAHFRSSHIMMAVGLSFALIGIEGTLALPGIEGTEVSSRGRLVSLVVVGLSPES